MDANFLMGEFNHTIDAKGRMNFPTKLRDALGSCFVITRGLDGCLSVYSLEGWSELDNKLRALPSAESRVMQRYIFSGAATVEPDKQGRILIPPHLRSHAGLDRDVVVIGRASQAEIWDKGRWDEMNGSFNENDIIETMTKLGF